MRNAAANVPYDEYYQECEPQASVGGDLTLSKTKNTQTQVIEYYTEAEWTAVTSDDLEWDCLICAAASLHVTVIFCYALYRAIFISKSSNGDKGTRGTEELILLSL